MTSAMRHGGLGFASGLGRWVAAVRLALGSLDLPGAGGHVGPIRDVGRRADIKGRRQIHRIGLNRLCQGRGGSGWHRRRTGFRAKSPTGIPVAGRRVFVAVIRGSAAHAGLAHARTLSHPEDDCRGEFSALHVGRQERSACQREGGRGAPPMGGRPAIWRKVIRPLLKS